MPSRVVPAPPRNATGLSAVQKSLLGQTAAAGKITKDMEIGSPAWNWAVNRRLWRNSHRIENGCIIWDGPLTPKGYGQLHVQGQNWRAHRLAYTVNKGPIPKGLTIDHLCRTRSCINPHHLDPVTQLENVRRGLNGRSKTHCPKKHPYSGDNLIKRNGHRECRSCRNKAKLKRWHANKADASVTP